MFPFDPNVMPTLPTRKGLLVIDFQNDFLAADGALPVAEPDALVSRTLDLVKAFRKTGEIIWVHTEFEKHRPSSAEQILATDAMPKPTILTSRYRRRPAAVQQESEEPDTDRDPEAFLSQPGPPVVRPSTSGAQFPAAVKDAIAPRDIKFLKSHYSAFKSGQLLQMLRFKFVTELFLCGSLANVGVHATAVDAVKYGYSITLVEDCCGFISELRLSNTMRSLVDLTGCDVLEGTAVVEKLQAKKSPASAASNFSSPVVPKRLRETTDDEILVASDASTPTSQSLEEKLAGLKLENDAGRPSPASRLARSARYRYPDYSECATISDMLEVDPDAQPSSSSAPIISESLAIEVSRNPDSALQPEEDTTSGPQIIEAASEDEKTPASDPELEVDTITASAETGTMNSEDFDKEDALKVSEPLCEGDTTVVYNIIPKPLAEDIFEKVRDEVSWQRMSHQGGEVPRLVAVQGEVAGDGSMPVYRHPSDESPPLLSFSPAVREIKTEVEKQLGHPLNHALIQFYRDGTDYISEHSDKTLDIVKGSYIANVSLGAERTMVFRTKRRDKDPSSTESPSGEDSKKRQIARAKLPHNSLCRMGLETNMRWLHAIRQDKRMERDKTPAELAFSGGRISLTFRQIGTFLDRDGTVIWGQGATCKSRDEAKLVINGQSPEAVGMLHAFGTENHSTTFDWDRHYGMGFDVLHMNHSPRLCVSADSVVNTRIALMLAEYGISYAKGSMSSSFNWKDGEGGNNTSATTESPPIRFIDNDAAKSTVQGELAIMLYLDGVYGPATADAAGKSHSDLARILTRFQQGLALLEKWRQLQRGDEGKRDLKSLKKELAIWGGYSGESEFIAGERISLADFAVWPVLHTIVEDFGAEALATTGKLKGYYERFKSRDSTTKVLGTDRPEGASTP
ncbi:isochorismatase family protein family [Colletotrichum kahawae]|uniref:Isochorismatase family protein family n=1 Tax=Colletotrichum kahawae TaxID=34407 RepID=A0AAD9Y5P8_COLKA|nr:isochorismatase family protein family [Colletotrichum kahawae]